MTASKVRADYEQLTAIAQAFGRQAEIARQMLGALQSHMATLQGGDWVGKSADKLYAEMNTAVLPAMGRVAAAMSEAASTTAKISRVTKQAEADSAALFRLDGNGAGTLAGGNGVGAGPAAAFLGGPADARSRGGPAGRAPSTDTMMAGLSHGLKKMVKESSTLTIHMDKLGNQGWQIKTGQGGINWEDKIINIDSDLPLALQARRLVNAMADVTYGKPIHHARTPSMTPDEYVRLNVNEELLATGNRILLEREVYDQTKGKIPFSFDLDPGYYGKGYDEVFERHMKRQINEAQARQELGNIWGADTRGLYSHTPRPTGSSNYKILANWYTRMWAHEAPK
jgi:WXG100 family type VII secretion target